MMSYGTYRDPWNPKEAEQPVGPVQSTQALPFLEPTEPQGPDAIWKSPSSNIFDYNDPYQINSIADVILKNLPKGIPTQHDGSIYNPFKAVLGMVPDLTDLVVRGTINPLKQGNMDAFKDNFLINLNETMGILGNPVKAMMQGYGKQGVLDALGYGGNGRKNFDWNTGNVFNDMALEFMSDPFTWITLGASAASHAAASGAVDAALAAGDVSLTTTEHAALKQLTTKAIKSYLRGDSVSLTEAMAKITESLSTPVTAGLLSNFSKVNIGKIVDMAGSISTEMMTDTVLKHIRNITSVSEGIQRGLFDSVLTTSGILPAYKLVSLTSSAIHKASRNRVAHTAQNYTVPGTNIVDTFRLPDLKHEFDDQIVQLNSAATFADDVGVDPAMFKTQMQKEVTSQLSKMDAIIDKNVDNPEVLNGTLATLLGHPSQTVLTDYRDNLIKNNNLLGGIFDRQITELDSMIHRTTALKYNAEVKAVVSAVDVLQKDIDVQNESIRNILFKNTDDSIVTSVDAAIAEHKLQLDKKGYVMDSESLDTFLDAHKVTTLKKFEDTLVPKLMQELDSKETVWKQLGITMPNHATLFTANSIYRGAIEEVVNKMYDLKRSQLLGRAVDSNAQKQIMQQFNMTIETIKTLMKQYRKEISTTSYTDTSGIHTTMPRVTDMQLHSVGLIQKGRHISNSLTVQPIQINKFKDLKADTVKVFIDVKNIDELGKIFSISKMSPGEFRSNILGFMNMSDAAISDPEKFIGTTEAQVLYRKAWNRYQYTLQQLLAEVKKNKETVMVYNPTQVHSVEDEIMQNLVPEPVRKYADLEKKLTDLLKRTTAMNPTRFADVNINFNMNTVLQQVKLEESYKYELLLGSPQTRTLREFLNGIRLNNTPLAHSITESDTPVSAVLQLYAHTTHNYKVLLDRIHASNVLDKQMKATFKSVLQTFKGIRADSYQHYFDWFTNSPENQDNLFNKITSFINTSQMRGSLSLDALAKHYKLIPEQLHSAASDVKTLEQVIDKALPDAFNTPGVTYVIADIETTGLSKYQNSVIEIAYKVKGSNEITTLMRDYKTLADYDFPQPSLLNKFFPGKTELEQQKLFKQRYSGKGNLSEIDMFTKFNEDLMKLGPNVQLVYHNGDSFDIPFQKYRADKDNRYFTTLSSVDTYKKLSEKLGYKVLSQPEKNELNAIMWEYVTLQNNTSPYTSLIKLPDRKLLHSIRQYNRQLKDDTLAQAAYELSDFYSKIGQQNELVGSNLMDAAQFNNHPDYDVMKKLGLGINNILAEDVVNNLDAYASRTGYTKEQLLNWTKFMNQFKLLYGLNDSETLAFGYKNVVNLPLINDWFQLETQQLPLRELEKLTKLSQRFQSVMQSIKNPTYIFAYKKDISESFQLMLKDVYQKTAFGNFVEQQILKPYSALRELNMPIAQFAVLRILSKSAIGNKLKFYRAMPDNLKKLLIDDAGVLNHSVMTDTEWTYMESQEHIDETSLFTNVDKLEAVISDFNHKVIDPLETLSRSMDVHEIVSANAIIQAQNLKPFADLLRSYTNILKSMPLHSSKAAFVRQLQKSTDKLAIAQVKQLLSITPDQLRSRMLYDAPWISFDIDEDLMDTDFSQAIQTVRKNKALYEQNDIQMIIEKDPVSLHTKMYFVLDLNKVQPQYAYDITKKAWVCSVNGNTVGLPIFDAAIDTFSNFNTGDLNQEITKVQQMMIRLSGQRSAGSLGDMLDQDVILQMYQNLPDSVKKFLPDFEEFANQEYWGTTHYNFMNIGTLASRKMLQPGYPTTILSLMKTSAAKTSMMSTTELSRLEAYFNPAFGINNGILARSDYAEALIESLKQHPEYTLSALVKDAKYGYKVIQLDANMPDVLQTARRLNAVVMPYHIYSKLSVVLNHHETSNRVMKFWNHMLWIYKAGCLMDPGVFFRNEIDSTLKVMTMTQTGIETIMKKAQASGLLRKYDNAYAEILNMSMYDIQKLVDQGVDPKLLDLYHDARSEEAKLVVMDLVNKYDLADTDIIKMDANKVYSQKNVDLYFNVMNPDISRQEYDLTSMFLQNASAGMTREMQEHFLEGNIDRSSTNPYWTAFLKCTNKLMRPNEVIDQTNRFAQFLIEVEGGNSTTKAFYDVARTHFDYANKTKAQRITELVLPFYTFKMRNLEFWANCIKDNPWIWTMLVDIMRPVWNFDDTTPEQLHYNKSLQYQVLAGNIPLDHGLVLKTNPSFMDAFNMAADPVNSVKSSLISPLDSVADNVIRALPDTTPANYLRSALSVYNSTGSGMYGAESSALTREDILGIAANLPLIGPSVQRYAISGPKNAERSGSILPALLPGIFGAIAPDKTFVRDLYPPKAQHAYSKRYYPKHGYFPYSKHPRKQYGKRPGAKVYAHRSYAYRVYADKVYPTRVFAPKSYPTQVYNKTSYHYHPGYYTNFYTKMYTKQGQSRFKLRQKLTQPQNLMAKLKDQFYN